LKHSVHYQHWKETATSSGFKTMLLHRVLFPTPYADASTNFDVLCIQQLMLNSHCKCLVSTTPVFMSSSSHVDQY